MLKFAMTLSIRHFAIAFRLLITLYFAACRIMRLRQRYATALDVTPATSL